MTELRVFTTTIMGSVPAAFYWALGLLLLVGVVYLNRLSGSRGSRSSSVNDNENRLRGSSCSRSSNGSIVNANHNAYHYWGRSVAKLLLVEWIILVLGIAVIFREPRAERSFCLVPFSSYFDYGTNSYFMEKAALNILNVVLFMPVGLFLGCGFKNMTWKRTFIIAAALAISIELLQLIFIKGLCEVDDVIHNVLGCMIGYGVASVFKR